MTLDDLAFVWEGDASGGKVIVPDGTVVARRKFEFVARFDGGWEEVGPGTAVLDPPDTDIAPDDGTGSGTDDWYTIKGRPWKCMNCGASKPYVAEKMDPHRILVWPSKDDPTLKRELKEISEGGEKCSVVAYEKSMGDCVSWYEAYPS